MYKNDYLLSWGKSHLPTPTLPPYKAFCTIWIFCVARGTSGRWSTTCCGWTMTIDIKPGHKTENISKTSSFYLHWLMSQRHQCSESVQLKNERQGLIHVTMTVPRSNKHRKTEKYLWKEWWLRLAGARTNKWRLEPPKQRREEPPMGLLTSFGHKMSSVMVDFRRLNRNTKIYL